MYNLYKLYNLIYDDSMKIKKKKEWQKERFLQGKSKKTEKYSWSLYENLELYVLNKNKKVWKE